MPEDVKLLVYKATNKLQAVLGYLELHDYAKAGLEVRDAKELLDRLGLHVAGLICKGVIPTDETAK